MFHTFFLLCPRISSAFSHLIQEPETWSIAHAELPRSESISYKCLILNIIDCLISCQCRCRRLKNGCKSVKKHDALNRQHCDESSFTPMFAARRTSKGSKHTSTLNEVT